MPDGLDPHRDNWVPVPLMVNEYDRETRTYAIEFTAPKQLLLNPQFEAMVHDELLRNADRLGLVVEGQVVITTRDKDAPEVVADETVGRDSTVQDVLLHPEKEKEVQAEQDAIESPYKMSKAEQAYRAKIRQGLRDTGMEALGFVQRTLDGTEIEGSDRKFKVDPQAFLEGFHGVSATPPRKIESMVVRVEAMISVALTEMDPVERGTTVEQENAAGPVADNTLAKYLDSIPDDLSELDDE